MIGLVTATRGEISVFMKNIVITKEYHLQGVQFVESTFRGVQIVIVVTGVGLKKSGSATRLLLRNHDLDLVISAGFAGSLREELKVGDIILGDSVCMLENEFEKKIELLVVESDHRKGGIISSRGFINSTYEKADLSSATYADCVDMESWSVVGAAAENGKPVIGIRSISDDLNSELPDMGKLFNRDTTINIYGAIRYFFKNPRHLYTFFRFMYVDSRKAASSLSEALAQLIPELNICR